MRDKMQILADLKQSVSIDPREVIKKLIEQELSFDSIMMEECGFYYIITFDDSTPITQRHKNAITKEKFEYINSLIKVYDHLKKSKI
jgi:hypothetical protein